MFFVCVLGSNAQEEGFKGIIPARATCQEVIDVFKAEDCQYPVSRFKTEDSRIMVEFTTEHFEKKAGICWNLQPHTVIRISARLNNSIPLSDFPYPLTFVRGPIDDIFIREFENKVRGIKAYVLNDRVYQVDYLPKDSDSERFAFPCEFKETIEASDLPSNWIERFWEGGIDEISPVIDVTSRIFDNRPDYTMLYIVYFHRSEEDKKAGLAKALRTKKAFENSGKFSREIRIFDGGRKKRSEIVLYPIGPVERGAKP